MPLPLPGVAFAPKPPGTTGQGLNEELVAWNLSASQRVPANTHLWTLTTDASHGFLPFWPFALQDTNQNPPPTRWFFATNVTDNTDRTGFVGPVSKIAQGQLKQKFSKAMQRVMILEKQRGALPKRLPLQEVPGEPIVKLAPERKHLWPASIIFPTALTQGFCYRVRGGLIVVDDQSPRSSQEAGNDRGAKEGRKVEA
jgi:hypothetical protein